MAVEMIFEAVASASAWSQSGIDFHIKYTELLELG
jgi:hypothetical protein